MALLRQELIPGPSACGGRAFLLGWGYNVTGASGIAAEVTILRSVTRYDAQDVALSQVSTQVIGGRAAIMIGAAGLAQRTLVYFPEPFGHTEIHFFNLPEAEVLKVAQAIVEASR